MDDIHVVGGKHLLLDLYDCEVDLDDHEFVLQTLTDAIVAAKCEPITSIKHKFEPHGLSIVMLLKESHVSYHSYPERRTCFIDLFVCSEKADLEVVRNLIVERFKPGNINMEKIVMRGDLYVGDYDTLNFPGEAYWCDKNDLMFLEGLFRQHMKTDSNMILEVATGPTIMIPCILKRSNLPFHYMSIEIDEETVNYQKRALEGDNIEFWVGDATQLPCDDQTVDFVVFHHALDDILEASGLDGLKQSILEALRVVKKGGVLIFTHCVIPADEWSKRIDLPFVWNFMKSRDLVMKKYKPSKLDILVVETETEKWN